MGVAYYIVLDNEEPGFETFVNGKYLAHDVNKIDVICRQLGLRKIDDYVAMSEDEILDIMGGEIELPEGEGEKWFTADEGMIFVTSLSAHIKKNPMDVKNSKGVLDNLSEYAELLCKAKVIGAKWHLNIDI